MDDAVGAIKTKSRVTSRSEATHLLVILYGEAKTRSRGREGLVYLKIASVQQAVGTAHSTELLASSVWVNTINSLHLCTSSLPLLFLAQMHIIFVSFLTFLPLASGRFFDMCPSRRQSIGACLAGLCPAGSECINGYCCKGKKAEKLEKVEVEVENLEFGGCTNGRKAIGECIADTCPVGYNCVDGLCCDPDTMVPASTSSTPTTVLHTTQHGQGNYQQMKTSPAVSVSPSTETSEEEETTTEEHTTTTTTTIPTTITTEEELEEEEEEEEEEEITTTTEPVTTTTEQATTATKKASRRFKSRKTTKPTLEMTTSTTPMTTTTTHEEEYLTHEKCPIGEPIGECISNRCPEGHSCLDGFCCILTPQINCTDELVGCRAHLCDRKGYKQFMTNNCAKTCARCHLVNITINELKDCRDRRSDCEEWAAEGFCESTLYTTRQKIKFCGKSCKLC
ncbi:unnamed protein product [Caenorhabditis auriculariae]|uniref:ShKT domain-containing protein n=1 Tax=Caenorhabditis auriculariae TaxID=2777116 RepID=A0A8S1H1G7_9PELO|nr:unnamed protein product [Caenorhabditis auriculariae]